MSAIASAKPNIRAVRAELVGLDRHRVAIITVIAGDELPEIIMYRGDPFLLDAAFFGQVYRQVRPFRADVGE